MKLPLTPRWRLVTQLLVLPQIDGIFWDSGLQPRTAAIGRGYPQTVGQPEEPFRPLPLGGWYQIA